MFVFLIHIMHLVYAHALHSDVENIALKFANLNITSCQATAQEIKKNLFDAKPRQSHKKQTTITPEMINDIKENDFTLIDLHIDSEHYDQTIGNNLIGSIHTFIIARLSENEYRIYQSWEDKYTLQEWIS